jgi:hypothetical protein
MSEESASFMFTLTMAELLVRPLGKNGPQVTALGFKTMGLSYLHGRLLSYEGASMCMIDYLNVGKHFGILQTIVSIQMTKFKRSGLI